MNENPPSFEALLRGVSFRPIEAKAIVNGLQEGSTLLVEREPTNNFDKNAIRVLDPDSGEFLGFVAKEIAVELAPWMDQGIEYTCTVGDRFSPAVVLLRLNPKEGKDVEENFDDA